MGLFLWWFFPQICPVCAAKIGTDMVGHVTLQHAHLFKISFLIAIMFLFSLDALWGLQFEMPSHENLREERRGNFHFINVECVALTAAYMQRRRRFRRGGTPSSATLSLLGKELREAHLQALFGGGTSRIGSLGTTATDPLLTNLDYSLPISEAEDTPKSSVTIDTPSKPLTSIHQPSPRLKLSLSSARSSIWWLALWSLASIVTKSNCFWENPKWSERPETKRQYPHCAYVCLWSSSKTTSSALWSRFGVLFEVWD